jgi:hypothetical protein
MLLSESYAMMWSSLVQQVIRQPCARGFKKVIGWENIYPEDF